MDSIVKDVSYGVRSLLKQPGFALIAVITLSLGIGANTALFSVLDALLLRKLPVKDPDQLVLFNSISNREFSPGSHNGSNSRDKSTGLMTRSSFPYQTYLRMREAPGALSDIVAFGSLSVNVIAGGQADVAQGQAVSGNYFAVLGVPAFLGRTIQESDDNAAATPVAVLSHRYWRNRFGSDRTIVGKQVNFNNVAFTVAGVATPGFEGTMQVGSTQDVYIPLAWEQQVSNERSMMKKEVWWLRLMGRLKAGASAEQAREGLNGAFQQSVLEQRAAFEQVIKESLPPLQPKNYPQLGVFSGAQGEMGSRRFYERPLFLLLGVVALVLVIACANVANLLLVRGSTRQKELAVRLALGASRWRLVRQLLTESVLLATAGGAVGVLFAMWIKDGLLTVTGWAGNEMAGLDPRLDRRVLAFTMVVSLSTGIVFGLIPALRATRLNLTPALKDSGRSSSGASRSWLTRSLVVVQVSVSLLLLIGAGLLVRTLINLRHVDTGFNENNLLLFSVEPTLLGYKGDRLASLYERMSERIEAVPGVTATTFSELPLLSFMSSSSSIFLPGAKAGPDGRFVPSGEVYIQEVRENFLATMQIPLLAGRSLNTSDGAHAPKVAVINQTFASRFFPNQDPIGKRFGFDHTKPEEFEIIGLAKDAKYTSQRDETPSTAYLCWLQDLPSVGFVTFEVRTIGDPNGAVSAIRQAVREVDNNLPLKDVKTQVEQANETLAMERLFAKLLSLFGLLAQQLAAIGLYGILAWSVSQRTQEIGIRMALGADRGKVLRMIMKEGLVLIAVGVSLGLGGAYVLAKYLDSLTTMLYGVEPRDLLTFGVAAVLLTSIALLACYLPARRATKVDPLEALRWE